MTLLGVLGILLGLVGLPFAFTQRTPARLAIFFAVYFGHLLITGIYYLYQQVYQGDAYLYYSDIHGFFGKVTGFGTAAIISIVQNMRLIVGGTFLDYFLVWQAFGFIGLAFVMRSIQEVCDDLNFQQPVLFYFIFAMPSLYFWTVALGKDPPMFMASCMAIWSVLKIERRWWVFILAVLLMMIIRPHVAMTAVVALGLSMLLNRNVSMAVRLLLGLIVAAGAGYLLIVVQETLNLDASSATSVGEFVERFDSQSEELVTADLVDANYLFKLFSLVFRPFFIDASGAFGLVASVSNIVYLYMFFTIARNWKLAKFLFFNAMIFRFCVLFYWGFLGTCAIISYNIGLGLRQREMVTPALIIMFAIVWVLKERETRRSADVIVPNAYRRVAHG